MLLYLHGPFDHLALESVLYQSFLTTTVLWSDQHPQTEFDLLFWRKAEHFLKQNTMFPEQPDSLNSPVLGVPVALFRLAIQAKQAYQLPGSCSSSELAQLRAEIEDWEAFVLGNGPVGVSNDINAFHRQQLYYDGATHLYVLIISLLLEQANAKSAPADQQDLQNARLPQALPKSTWQIQKALEVLHTFELDDDWSSCYIGTWPVYTMGFFLSEVKDIGLIRGEMDRRWRITNNMQIPRFRGDLEAAWLARGRSQDPHQMEIYGYATDIETAPLFDYAGLHMSCQQIKQEMEHEVLRLLHVYFKRKLLTTPGLGIELPTTFKEVGKLRISLSAEVWACCLYTRRPFCGCADRKRCVDWILGLCLDSLTIAYHEDESAQYEALNFSFLDAGTLRQVGSGHKARSLTPNWDLIEVKRHVAPESWPRIKIEKLLHKLLAWLMLLIIAIGVAGDLQPLLQEHCILALCITAGLVVFNKLQDH
ncbi:hypothetical protein SNOG_10952 [Parastagonospora nodorum SN15]|uniref:Uncharacterized protein n=1 Tax=Phaeosphaeria nodorum (strain SN15 / ATCC MYA-4574 / FGSC 10173) TaxID=321614 RepID=Q0UBB2_PHANO|nr:hypothetical protein SNOG_10952 [Parastagonospora nodorum SN15]EAT81451.2 hypothetical protein SNOG_10952 [Parastagonospora nodorum SN15]